MTSIQRLTDPTEPAVTAPTGTGTDADPVVGGRFETAERSTIVVNATTGPAVHPSSPTGRGPRLDVAAVNAARHRHRRRMTLVAVPLALVAGLAFSACGSDDDGASPATTAPLPGAVTTTTAAAVDEVEVHAIDFAFTGLPEKVPAGTRLKLVNDAETEVHELVAFRLPDGEERSVQEILELPEEEAQAIMGGGPPALVIMAAPGGEEIHAVGDGVLSKPGRYLVMCSVPEGSDASILDSDAPPSSNRRPHFAHGMHAELLVE